MIKLMTDAGYELWLTNSRGNRFSFEHEVYTVDDEAFWNFSFEEMGVYDQPAHVAYITKVTGAQKIHAYIGHS